MVGVILVLLALTCLTSLSLSHETTAIQQGRAVDDGGRAKQWFNNLRNKKEKRNLAILFLILHLPTSSVTLNGAYTVLLLLLLLLLCLASPWSLNSQ